MTPQPAQPAAAVPGPALSRARHPLRQSRRDPGKLTPVGPPEPLWSRAGWHRLIAACLLFHIGNAVAAACGVPEIDYTVTAEYNHDPGAFTQGLTFAGANLLMEGTGLYGSSRLGIAIFPAGDRLRLISLPEGLFGEGVTVMGERVFQLTWKAGRALVYRLGGLDLIATHDYDGEGWGLTDDGYRLIMSTGGHELVFRDPGDFSITARLPVRIGQRPLEGLNELEYVAGDVFANVWPTDCVARIDVGTGQVSGWLDLSPLRDRMPPLTSAAVANGIAYHGSSGHLLVTGKLWPKMFELRLDPP